MTTEEWRPTPQNPAYLVSTAGRVISHRRKLPREIDGAVNDKGYRYVWLCDDQGRRKVAVHALVASAFLGPRPEGQEVRHLDGNSQNNHLANLAYGTHGANMLDQVVHGTHAAAKRSHCPQGHAYDEANTYRPPGRPRTRYCRACQRASSRLARTA